MPRELSRMRYVALNRFNTLANAVAIDCESQGRLIILVSLPLAFYALHHRYTVSIYKAINKKKYANYVC